MTLLPACPVYEHTGVYCPGCGSLRATHRLLTGRFAEAARFNIMLVTLGVPLAIWFWAEQISIVARGLRFRPPIKAAAVAWIALALLLGFTIVRNLPGERFDVLRPPHDHAHD